MRTPALLLIATLAVLGAQDTTAAGFGRRLQNFTSDSSSSSSSSASSCAGHGRQIVVNGYGVVQADSDVARVDVRVEATETTAALARTATVKGVDAISKALKQAYPGGVSLTVTGHSVYTTSSYNDTTGRSMVTGYTYSQTLKIVVARLSSENLAKVIDAITSTSGDSQTSINTIEFGVSQAVEDRLWQEARREAAADALGAAELYAQSLGVQISEAVAFTEVEGNSGAPNPYDSKSDDQDDNDGDADVSLGKSEVSVKVVATYTIA